MNVIPLMLKISLFCFLFDLLEAYYTTQPLSGSQCYLSPPRSAQCTNITLSLKYSPPGIATIQNLTFNIVSSQTVRIQQGYELCIIPSSKSTKLQMSFVSPSINLASLSCQFSDYSLNVIAPNTPISPFCNTITNVCSVPLQILSYAQLQTNYFGIFFNVQLKRLQSFTNAYDYVDMKTVYNRNEFASIVTLTFNGTHPSDAKGNLIFNLQPRSAAEQKDLINLSQNYVIISGAFQTTSVLKLQLALGNVSKFLNYLTYSLVNNSTYLGNSIISANIKYNNSLGVTSYSSSSMNVTLTPICGGYVKVFAPAVIRDTLGGKNNTSIDMDYVNCFWLVYNSTMAISNAITINTNANCSSSITFQTSSSSPNYDLCLAQTSTWIKFALPSFLTIKYSATNYSTSTNSFELVLLNGARDFSSSIISISSVSILGNELTSLITNTISSMLNDDYSPQIPFQVNISITSGRTGNIVLTNNPEFLNFGALLIVATDLVKKCLSTPLFCNSYDFESIVIKYSLTLLNSAWNSSQLITCIYGWIGSDGVTCSCFPNYGGPDCSLNMTPSIVKNTQAICDFLSPCNPNTIAYNPCCDLISEEVLMTSPSNGRILSYDTETNSYDRVLEIMCESNPLQCVNVYTSTAFHPTKPLLLYTTLKQSTNNILQINLTSGNQVGTFISFDQTFVEMFLNKYPQISSIEPLPYFIKFGEDRNLYVLDLTGFIHIFDMDGNYIETPYFDPTILGNFYTITDFTISKVQLIYEIATLVTTQVEQDVIITYEYDVNGTCFETITSNYINKTKLVATGNYKYAYAVYVTTFMQSSSNSNIQYPYVYEFHPRNSNYYYNFLSSQELFHLSRGAVFAKTSLAALYDGSLLIGLITSDLSRTVERYNSNGDYLYSFFPTFDTLNNLVNNGFDKLNGIEVSPSGLVYISGGDYASYHMTVYDVAGNFYGVLGSPGLISYAGKIQFADMAHAPRCSLEILTADQLNTFHAGDTIFVSVKLLNSRGLSPTIQVPVFVSASSSFLQNSISAYFVNFTQNSSTALFSLVLSQAGSYFINGNLLTNDGAVILKSPIALNISALDTIDTNYSRARGWGLQKCSAGKNASFVVFARDEFDNPIVGHTPNLQIFVDSELSSSIQAAEFIVSPFDSKSGTFDVSYVFFSSSVERFFSISLDGMVLYPSEYLVIFTPLDAISSAHTTISALQNSTTIFIYPKDIYGNSITSAFNISDFSIRVQTFGSNQPIAFNATKNAVLFAVEISFTNPDFATLELYVSYVPDNKNILPYPKTIYPSQILINYGTGLPYIRYFIMGAASFGSACSVVVLYFVYKYRHSNLMEMSLIPINVILLVSSLSSYSGLIYLVSFSESPPCRFYAWVAQLTSCITYSCICIKIWNLQVISIMQEGVKPTYFHADLRVGYIQFIFFLIAVIIFLVVWDIFAPLSEITTLLSIYDTNNVLNIISSTVCLSDIKSNKSFLFDVTSTIIQLIPILRSLGFAWSLRGKKDIFNERTPIVLVCTNNLIIICLAASILYLWNGYGGADFDSNIMISIISSVEMYTNIFAVMILFVPKIILLNREKDIDFNGETIARRSIFENYRFRFESESVIIGGKKSSLASKLPSDARNSDLKDPLEKKSLAYSGVSRNFQKDKNSRFS